MEEFSRCAGAETHHLMIFKGTFSHGDLTSHSQQPWGDYSENLEELWTRFSQFKRTVLNPFGRKNPLGGDGQMQEVLAKERISSSRLCCQALVSWFPEPGGHHLQTAQSEAGSAQENALPKSSWPASVHCSHLPWINDSTSLKFVPKNQNFYFFPCWNFADSNFPQKSFLPFCPNPIPVFVQIGAYT